MILKVPVYTLKDVLEKNKKKISEKDFKYLSQFIERWSNKDDITQINSQYLNKSIIDLFYAENDTIVGKNLKDKYFKRQLLVLKETLENPEGAKVNKLENLEQAAREYMKLSKNYIIFRKEDNYMNPFLVTNIKYEKPTQYTPAHVSISLKYVELGELHNGDVSFFRWEIVGGVSVKQLLDSKGFYITNDVLLKKYTEEFEVFDKYKNMIGEQFLAGGIGESFDRWGGKFVNLEVEGDKSKVVVDKVVHENKHSYKEELDTTTEGSILFEKVEFLKTPEDRGDTDDDEDDDGKAIAFNEFRVPTHLKLYVFNLKTDDYLKVHVSNVEPYKYDSTLIDKLILPTCDKDLINILVDGTKDLIEDIVKGKTGGIIVLSTGIPGTGKTLTAEVYSEVIKRPLYTVQSSQLGVELKDLENNLREILSRAARWNAILLIDEADVYLHERGDDLIQNAVVGVFLRVLEYYKGILFLTSNKDVVIDDAIVSRATAHIRYTVPTLINAKKIWKILSEQFNIGLDEIEIDKIIKEFPNVTGRDIKNLLKLARLLAKRRNCKVDLELIKFVSTFHDLNTYKEPIK